MIFFFIKICFLAKFDTIYTNKSQLSGSAQLHSEPVQIQEVVAQWVSLVPVCHAYINTLAFFHVHVWTRPIVFTFVLFYILHDCHGHGILYPIILYGVFSLLEVVCFPIICYINFNWIVIALAFITQFLISLLKIVFILNLSFYLNTSIHKSFVPGPQKEETDFIVPQFLCNHTCTKSEIFVIWRINFMVFAA